MSLTLIFSYFHFKTRFDDDVIDEDCEGNDNDNDRINIASLSLSQDEVISKCKFSDADHITPTNGLDCSIIEDTFDSITHEHESGRSSSHTNHSIQNTFRTVLELIHGSLVGSPTFQMFSHQDINEMANISQNDESYPTIAGVAQTLARREGKVLDEKQYITYEMLCCTFLLQLVNETLDPTSSVHKQVGVSISMDDNSELVDDIKQQLIARGGRDQLLLFLTGPAGAGKTTAIKAAERFCFEFCSSCNIIWTDTSFFYTAYTGSAASAFGGRTIVKASGMFMTTVTELQRLEWSSVRVLVIDEISFMTESELMKLDVRLRQYKDRNKVFGGYSVIFGGDFRQLIRGNDHELLYSRNSKQFFESILTGVVILDNEHRFKEDPEFGKLLKRFWRGELTHKDRNTINKRVITRTDVDLPKNIASNVDWSYACPTNRERNAISAGIFKQHVLDTHPTALSHDLPPDHTMVIEGDFQTSSKKKASSLKVNNTLRHRILTTCGDDNITYGSHKHADPALCLYTGINLICVMSNEKMEEKPPRGNGTVCSLVSVKIKQGATTHRWREMYGRKVWSVNIKDVEWLTVQLADNSEEISNLEREIDDFEKDPTINPERLVTLQRLLQFKRKQRLFKIQPEQHEVSIAVTPTRLCDIKETFRCHMTLFPVNINTSSTGHKLQGRSKDIVIVSSWPKLKNNICFRNWEYVVLSRVRTLKGLFLFHPIDMEQSFKPTDELVQFMKRAERMENTLLQKRHNATRH